jgi:hypothetical protein
MKLKEWLISFCLTFAQIWQLQDYEQYMKIKILEIFHQM